MSTSLAQTIQKLSPSAVRPGKKHWESGGEPLEKWLVKTCDTLLARQQPSDTRPETRLTWRLLELQGVDLPERFDALLLEANDTLTHAAEVAELTPLLLPLLGVLPLERATAALDGFYVRAARAALIGPPPWATDALRLMGEPAAQQLLRALELRMERLDLGCHFDQLPFKASYLSRVSQLREPNKLLHSLTTFQLTWGLSLLQPLPAPLPKRWLGLLRHELNVAMKGTFDPLLQIEDFIGAALAALPLPERLSLLNTSDEAIPWPWVHQGEDDEALLRAVAQSKGLHHTNPTLQRAARDAVVRIGAPLIPHLLQTIREQPAKATRLLAHLIALPPDLNPQEALDLLPLFESAQAIDLLGHLLLKLPREATLRAILHTWQDAPTPLRGYLALILLAFNADTPLPEATLRALLTEDMRANYTATKALHLALEDQGEALDARARRIAPVLLEPSQFGLTQPPAPPLREESLREDTTQLARSLDKTLTYHDPVSAALLSPHLLARAAAHPDGALLAWCHVLTCKLTSSNRDALVQLYHAAFGATRFIQSALALLEATADEHLSHTTDAVTYLVEQERTSLDLELRLLRTGLLTLQDLAVGALARRGEEAAEGLTALLTHGKAAMRTGAARALERLALPSTLSALREASKKEKSKKTKEILQLAIDAADPRREHPQDHAANLGAWTLDDLAAPDAQDLLAQLRDLLYQPPTSPLRFQIFDLLLRLHLAGSAPIGVSYLLAHAQQHWPQELRILPWGFDTLTPFQPLLGTFKPPSDSSGISTTLAFLTCSAWPEAATRALKRVERNCRSRKLNPDDAAIFLQATLAGWRFCQHHHLPLANLHVRVDGGTLTSGAFANPTTTTLLLGGFGVFLYRRKPLKTQNVEGPGLRILRVTVPPRHRLRELHALKPQQRELDLTPDLLDAADRPPSPDEPT